jgi:multiple sugar transport system permease protein
MLRQFFMQIPKDLWDAATIDGCSRFGFLWRILVPLAVPPIITISIFTFLGSWNSLLWPLIVTNSQDMRTIQVGLSYFSQAEGTEWELLMAASTFCILPLVIGYFMLQKYFVQGEASSGLKG